MAAMGRQPLLPGAAQDRDARVQDLARNPKVARFIDMVSQNQIDTEKLQKAWEMLKPIMAATLQVLQCIGKVYYGLYAAAYQVYSKLPANEMEAVIGIILCFFGGMYVTLIAAVEAFRTMGGQSLYDELAYVMDEAQNVQSAHEKDETKDANNDGVADVDQMEAQELVTHKVNLAMRSVQDPKKLQSAVGCLWAACLAVLATLKLEFAQTTAYALAIADMVKFPVTRCTAPLLAYALGPDLVKWVDPIIDSTLKGILVLAVWFFAKIRAAFYSGLRGGKMFGAAAVKILEARGLTEKLPDFVVKKPFNPDDSYLDEAIGYSLAAVGFYFQLSHFFLFMPFPLDWILWPVTLAEQFLELQVTWS